MLGAGAMVPVYSDFKGGNMAFYRCCDIGDEFACEEILLNQFEYQRWLRVQPHPDDDVTAYCSALGARIDKTEHFVLRRIDAISTLLELKGLHKLFLQLWHLDMPRLMAIAQALGGVRKEHWPDIDAVLVKIDSYS
ncbi:HNH endonuclease [Corynebacterium diphtheriae]|nr:HNH endonuclease [Corynebacterium diphtheriae]